MILTANKKSLVFGMDWRILLGEGDVHKEARKTKSPYLWTGSKAPFYGVLGADDIGKKRQKPPLYSGAIALLNKFPDVPNILLCLAVPEGEGEGFIVCGIHQRRPKKEFDLIVQRPMQVVEKLTEFEKICGQQGFKLYGDLIQITNIQPTTLTDLAAAADNASQLYKVKSALVNPAVAVISGTVIVAASWYGIHSFMKFRAAEAQRKAAAAQKGAQELYNEELATRRNDAALVARSVPQVIEPLTNMSASVGGWPLARAECTVPVAKELVCIFDYTRKEESRATYKTFADAAAGFDNVEYGDNKITAAKTFKPAELLTHEKPIDAGKPQRDERIQFGTVLQTYSHFGKTRFEAYTPFAVPSGTNIAELVTPPVGAAKWEWIAPLRSVKDLANFPAYATVSKIVIVYTDKPNYDMKQSFAMATISGTVFSKPK